ncbi:hypothetical protein BU17DRAFT_93231 [Hysterangium stoloniferum]|nr:hypothetical protein BU17DRAFT_93231 [Hysterangium stoloniferum]
MEHHALAFLEDARHWGWPPLHFLNNLAYPMREGGEFPLNLIMHGVIESNRLQGGFMDEFWEALSKCHPTIEKNVAYLKSRARSIEPAKTMNYIMKGVGSAPIDHSPLDRLAGRVLKHLIIPFMQVPDNRQYALAPETIAALQSKGCGPLTDAFFDKSTPTFLKEELLKFLLRRRDGAVCLVTGCRFKFQDEPGNDGVDPEVVYLIPDVFGKKREYMEFLERFVSPAIYHTVQLHIRGPGNAILLQKHARLAFEDFVWGIELREAADQKELSWFWLHEDLRQLGKDGSCNGSTSDLINLQHVRHGDRLWFGCGTDGAKLRYGPTPSADRLVQQLRVEANYSAFPTPMLRHDEFVSILTAKLLLLV